MPPKKKGGKKGKSKKVKKDEPHVMPDLQQHGCMLHMMAAIEADKLDDEYLTEQLKEGYNIDRQHPISHLTLLQYAARIGSVSSFTKLLAKGADPLARDIPAVIVQEAEGKKDKKDDKKKGDKKKSGDKGKDKKDAKKEPEMSAEDTVLFSLVTIRPDAENAGNSLHVAVQHGHLGIVQILLSHASALDLLNTRNNQGYTPAILAAAIGESKILSAMLAFNPSLMNTNDSHGRPLAYHSLGVHTPETVPPKALPFAWEIAATHANAAMIEACRKQGPYPGNLASALAKVVRTGNADEGVEASNLLMKMVISSDEKSKLIDVIKSTELVIRDGSLGLVDRLTKERTENKIVSWLSS